MTNKNGLLGNFGVDQLLRVNFGRPKSINPANGSKNEQNWSNQVGIGILPPAHVVALVPSRQGNLPLIYTPS